MWAKPNISFEGHSTLIKTRSTLAKQQVRTFVYFTLSFQTRWFFIFLPYETRVVRPQLSFLGLSLVGLFFFSSVNQLTEEKKEKSHQRKSQERPLGSWGTRFSNGKKPKNTTSLKRNIESGLFQWFAFVFLQNNFWKQDWQTGFIRKN